MSRACADTAETDKWTGWAAFWTSRSGLEPGDGGSRCRVSGLGYGGPSAGSVRHFKAAPGLCLGAAIETRKIWPGTGWVDLHYGYKFLGTLVLSSYKLQVLGLQFSPRLADLQIFLTIQS